MDIAKTLDNQAMSVMQKRHICETYDEPLYFALHDNHHEFSLPLSTLLECLKFAENNGAIPPIPTDWWGEISSRFYLPSDPLHNNV